MAEYHDCPFCEIGTVFVDEFTLEGECDNCGRSVDASIVDAGFEEEYPAWDRDLYDERFGNND